MHFEMCKLAKSFVCAIDFKFFLFFADTVSESIFKEMLLAKVFQIYWQIIIPI